MTLLRTIIPVFLSASLLGAADAPKIRISGWYWLNSAPKTEWEKDFRDMRAMGFTDTLLCWGLNNAAWNLRRDDTKEALDACHRAKLGAYIMIWHPVHNALPRDPKNLQIDPDGNARFAFDVFLPSWRHSQWHDYLTEVGGNFKSHPALSGYVFDDSFSVGGIGAIDGPSPKGKSFVSYGSWEKKQFGGNPPANPSEPRWAEWTAMRANWWVDWARDTVAYLRAADPNRKHEIYLEDFDRILTPEAHNPTGVDFGRVGREFDAVGAYSEGDWRDINSTKMVADHTADVLRKTRAAVGPGKQIIYTFWVANLAEIPNSGPAKYPTEPQIQAVAEAALRAGIKHIDLYGYRIGDWSATSENWPKRRPGAGPSYYVLDHYPGKFLYDRPQVKEELGKYLRSLNN